MRRKDIRRLAKYSPVYEDLIKSSLRSMFFCIFLLSKATFKTIVPKKVRSISTDYFAQVYLVGLVVCITRPHL